ncbi:hypothetical protein L838_2809 [Mycobacterium avium MAV_120709_2344]|nr:hypothetical protein L838_2809 [Mycobacterium avium MAV_120709_2344]
MVTVMTMLTVGYVMLCLHLLGSDAFIGRLRGGTSRLDRSQERTS